MAIICAIAISSTTTASYSSRLRYNGILSPVPRRANFATIALSLLLATLMLNQLNLSDIRTFILIAELGNFTKAAEALQVSRSHVSRQISALEKQLGVTLLIRTTRSLTLTQTGQQLFAECQQALKQMEQALLAAVDDSQQVRGLIRINSVGGHIGEEFIARYVAEFMQLYPEVTIDLDFSSHRIDLIEDQFDIAIRMGDLEDAGFVGKLLTNIAMSTLASPAYLAQHGEPQQPKALLQHRILMGTVGRWRYQSVNDPKHTAEVNLKGQLISKNGRVLIAGALNGNGIIRVPTLYCPAEIAAGRLVAVMTGWQIPSVPLYAIYPKDNYLPRRLRVFLDFLNERVQQDPRWV